MVDETAFIASSEPPASNHGSEIETFLPVGTFQISGSVDGSLCEVANFNG